MCFNHSKPEVLFALEVMEKSARGYLSSRKNFLQFRVVIALQRKKTGRFGYNFVSRRNCP
jgi:hypothetical protein